MPPPPAGVKPEDWPAPPEGWAPGDDWPEGGQWAHDEALFIRTHQAFEVWFALIIHELSSVVREAGALWGSALPRIDFARRDPLEPPTPAVPGTGAGRTISSDAWPLSARVIRDAAARDPEAGSILARLAAPGRWGAAAALPPRMGESETFNQSLVRWTQRVQRASKALLATIPFFDVLATMTPAEFLRFRGRLQPASGFGSVQFRELELLLGLRELHEKKLRPDLGDQQGGASGDEPAPPEGMLRPTAQTPSNQRAASFYFAQPPWGWARVARRAREHSLRDVVYALLGAALGAGSGPGGPEKGLPDLRPAALDDFLARVLTSMLEDHYRGVSGAVLDEAGRRQLEHATGSLDAALAHSETLVAAFIDMHPAQERLAQFLAACIEMDEAMLRWRDRHIRFVEVMIGMRRGTGGGGIQYLRTTVAPKPPADGPHLTHAFPCLWQARSFVQRR